MFGCGCVVLWISIVSLFAQLTVLASRVVQTLTLARHPVAVVCVTTAVARTAAWRNAH